MFSKYLKSLSILKKFLFINFIIFTIISLFTFIYLSNVQPNLIKKKSVKHINVIDNTINTLIRLDIKFVDDDIRKFLFSTRFIFQNLDRVIFFDNDFNLIGDTDTLDLDPRSFSTRLDDIEFESLNESKNLNKNNTTYWVKATISPIFDEDGNKTGYTAIRQDITDKKIIEEISIRDGLTSIFNRRHFNEVFPDFINSAKRNKEHICFMILDIDYFKQYNDSYGHLQGDFALKSVGSVLAKASQRSYDFAFRVGGEEFALIFYNDDYKSACAYVEKIRDNVEKLKIEHQENKASKYVTISIGFTYFPNPGDFTLNQMYEEVDSLLYQAKEKGRNQVVTKLEDFEF